MMTFLFIVPLLFLGDYPFSPNVRVSYDVGPVVNQGESSFAVYNDSIFAICNIAERSIIPEIPFARSVSGGDTFELNYNFIDNTTGITWHTDPVIAVDDSGNLHMLVQFSIYLIKHYISRDGGETWEDTSFVSDTLSGGEVDKPWMVISGNRIYVTWQEFGGLYDGIRFAKSEDYGHTWTRTVIDSSRHGITAINLGDDGTIYVVYTSSFGLYFTKSTDGGINFTPPEMLNSVFYSGGIGDRAPIVSLAVKGDVLFVTWVDDRAGSWDIWCMKSFDGGETWSSPTRVNDIYGGGQCKSWTTFDPYGGLHVFYYHTWDWPTELTSLWEVRYRYSPDSGNTFEPSVRITDTVFLAHYYDDYTNFMGDYHTIQADSHYIYAVWTDGRDGDMNLYFAKALLPVLIKEGESEKLNEPLKLCTLSRGKISVSILRPPQNLSLYDISGRRLFKKTVRERGIFLLKQNLQSGVYILKVEGGKKVSVYKIVNLK